MSNKVLTACWLLIGITTLYAASLPLGLEAQLAVTLVAITAMSLIKLFRLRGAFRSIFLGLGTFIILRYLFWRLGNTIPPLDSPGDFAAGIILVIAECYCILMMFLSLFTVADPIDRPEAPRVPPELAPSVDVFVPSYNESTEILATTLAAAKRMIYPEGKLNVFLLDDGGTDQKVNAEDPASAAAALARRNSLQALCQELGVNYLTRQVNSHAKAGNLNNGLLHTTGDLVVVFDADHAPSQEFLTETVGYFEDEKLFLVQTPHFFLNVDPIEKNLRFRSMPAENEMFYGIVQRGLDKWNAAFFCGSAAVLRRQALEEVEGFQGSSITEDCESALELHSRGWKSLYIDRPMIAGLQPETFESFIGQRSRWCRGMVQILLMKNPLFKRGLSLPQRLCYLSSSMFWLFPLSRMIFFFAPMCYIFFGMKIYIANQPEFIAYTMTYMVAGAMIQSYIFGAVRWPWTSDLYEYIQSVQLFRAVISVFINPRKPKFDVTAKGLTLEKDHLSSIAAPYFVVFGLIAASLLVLIHRYLNEVNARDLLTVVGIWTLFNLILSGIALGAVAERRERRSVPRVQSAIAATLVIEGSEIPVTVRDMSFGGLRVQAETSLHYAPRSAGLLRMAVPNHPETVWETPVIGAARRKFDSGDGIGLRFTGVNADRYRITAQVMFANVVKAHERRSQGYRVLGVLQATALLASWCWVHTGRGLYFAVFRRSKMEAALPPKAEPKRRARIERRNA